MHLQHLLWLSYKQWANKFKSYSTTSKIGFLLIFGIVILLELFLSYGLYLLIKQSKEPFELLYLMFTTTYLWLVIVPFLNPIQFSEIIKLLPYPVSNIEIFLSRLISMLVSSTTIVLFLLAIILGLNFSFIESIIVFIMGYIFYIHGAGLSLILSILLYGVFSRIKKTISLLFIIILFFFVAITSYKIITIWTNVESGYSNLYLFINKYTIWLPSNLLTQLIKNTGYYNELFYLNIVFLIAITIITLYLGSIAIDRIIFLKSQTTIITSRTSSEHINLLPFSVQTNSIFWKEWLYFQRHRLEKMKLMSFFVIMTILAVASQSIPYVNENPLLSLAFMSIMTSYFGSTQHIFFHEDKRAWMPLLSPLNRRYFIFGKNLLLFVTIVPAIMIFMIGFASYLNSLNVFPIFAINVISLILLFSSMNNIFSIIFHFSMEKIMLKKIKKTKTYFEKLSALVVILPAIPIFLIITIPIFLNTIYIIWTILSLSGLVYAYIYYSILLGKSAKLLVQKEGEILEDLSGY